MFEHFFFQKKKCNLFPGTEIQFDEYKIADLFGFTNNDSTWDENL